MKAHYDFDDPVQAASFDLDCAQDHLDTCQYYMSDAIGYLDGARKTRAEEILDKVTRALADLDRLREAL
ncbi:hypothetical protein A5633_03020 [Mycolicibacterium elephantis]|uniref:hypothetical protein n=1 Tax=Mycolicibacterium elephantis TaxID=81858 RepID=UPI0007EB093A|nr:hypothetical protein [Mycolicibacterium elephantis]OBA66050.1 hypothetical protein A5633_03020 [Mycolicibacterium elephantis]